MAVERSQVTCHVLDASLGKPASGVGVSLGKLGEVGSFTPLAEGITDYDGRCLTLLPSTVRLASGMYKIVFQTGIYFSGTTRETFYPIVEITFNLVHPEQHYHVPLLISPWSYTTYRGS